MAVIFRQANLKRSETIEIKNHKTRFLYRLYPYNCFYSTLHDGRKHPLW